MTFVARALRPGIIETAVMATAIMLLAAGVPWGWTSVLTRGDSTSGGDVFVSLLFVALTGFLALQMTGRWTGFFNILGREPLLLLFLAWAAISVLWSPDVFLSARRIVSVIVTTYMGIHLVLRFSQFQILRLLASVMVFVALINLFWIVALPQYSGPSGGERAAGLDFDDRLTGIYTQANALGRVMALGVFTMLAALKLDRRRRPLYVVGLAASGLVLAFSQSKTSLVVSALSATLLIVFIVFRARKTLFGAVVISVVGSAVVSLALVISNLGFITESLDRDVTLSGRVPLWQDLLARVPERPILGRGFNGFWNGWGSPAQRVWNAHPWLPPHGHNQFIDVMLDLGLIGLVLYSALFIRTLVRATWCVRDIPGVFGLWPLTYCCIFLLGTLTESAIISRDIVWFLYVSSIILVSTKKTDIDQPSSELDRPSAIGTHAPMSI